MRYGSLLAICFCIASLGDLQAQEARPPQEPLWVAASGGAIPAGSVAYGREADGREQFACRGAHAGGTHLGKIAAGLGGCKIGYGGRELTLSEYEVLARPPLRAAHAVGRLHHTSVSETPALSAANARAVSVAKTTVPSIPPMPAGTDVMRGFDDNGQPYVMFRRTDGTIERREWNRIILIKPDGKTTVIPFTGIRSDTQAGTPPELPTDPQRGRGWIEEHNKALFALIESLVNGNTNEMAKFKAAEQQKVGNDLFAQIAYRTTTANVLAAHR